MRTLVVLGHLGPFAATLAGRECDTEQRGNGPLIVLSCYTLIQSAIQHSRINISLPSGKDLDQPEPKKTIP